MYEDTGDARPRKRCSKKDKKNLDKERNYDQDKIKDFKRRKKTYQEEDNDWIKEIEKYK